MQRGARTRLLPCQRTRGCKCGSALKNAIITQKTMVPQATLDRLWLLVGKYFDSEKKVGA